MSEYGHFRVRPLSPAIGAEVSGLDLSPPPGDEAVAELRRAWLEHHVLFFRGQSLDVDAHKAFARRFGTLAIDKFVRGPKDHPEMMPGIPARMVRTRRRLTKAGAISDESAATRKPGALYTAANRHRPAGGGRWWTYPVLVDS